MKPSKPPSAFDVLTADPWRAHMQSARLSNGTRLAWASLGASGPVLVLIHGFSDTSRSFQLLAPLLHGFRLIIPDLRGHGQSVSDGQSFAISDFADDVERLIAHLELRDFTIVGHSLGALVAQELASRNLGGLKALALLAGCMETGFPPDGPIVSGINRWSAQSDLSPENAFFHYWYSGMESVPPFFADEVKREALQIDFRIWQATLQSLQNYSAAGKLRDFKKPVMAVSGSHDGIFGPAHTRALQAEIPNAQFISLECGHNPHWEKPQEIARLLTGFA